MKLVLTLIILTICLPGRSNAQINWAAWGSPSGNVNTGIFGDGKTVTLTSFFDGISGGTIAGAGFTANPPLPGLPDGSSPTYMGMLTGSPHPMLIPSGAQVAALDLMTVSVDTATLVGFSDFKNGNWYVLELQDASGAPLSLAGLRIQHHDITLAGLLWVADYDLDVNLTNGLIVVHGVHTVPEAFYEHSGVTLLSNLPPLTRRIVLRSGKSQESEGISIYLGANVTVPVAPTTWSRIKTLSSTGQAVGS